MLSIDRRKGSAELAPLFDGLHVPYQVEELPFGDFSFVGNGVKGPGLIGVERKRIGDLINSMCDGRLVGHQLPGMFEYFDHSYLIVEGVLRPEPTTGILQQGVEDKRGAMWWKDITLGRRRFMWRDLDGFLTTVEHSRVKVRRTDSSWMTAHTVASIYHWYTHKAWSEHDSLRQLHSVPFPVMTMEDKRNIVRRIAKEFAHIGVEKSLAVAMKFRSVWDMVTADRSEWETIPGIGPGISKRVQEEIHGRNETEYPDYPASEPA